MTPSLTLPFPQNSQRRARIFSEILSFEKSFLAQSDVTWNDRISMFSNNQPNFESANSFPEFCRLLFITLFPIVDRVSIDFIFSLFLETKLFSLVLDQYIVEYLLIPREKRISIVE